MHIPKIVITIRLSTYKTMDITATAVIPPRFIKTILRINAIMELEILLKNSEEPFANKEIVLPESFLI